MLVVIAILGVLAALVLPALAGVKKSAQRVECQSRMKQWSAAFLSYTDDNDGMMPREGYHTNGQVWWNNWNQIRHSLSQDVWYNALSNDLHLPAAAAYASATARLTFYDRASFFQCPAARIPGSAATPTFQIALFSIAMNSQLIEPPDVPTTSIFRLSRPANTVLFLDNLLEGEARVTEAQAWTDLGQPAAMATRFAGVRHRKGGNLAFSDGSVRWLAGDKVVETKAPAAGWSIWPESEVVWHLESSTP